MRVMFLRETRRKPRAPWVKDGKRHKFAPKPVRHHRLFCPVGWDGFQLGDVLQAADGFRWEYVNYEVGAAKKAVAKIMAEKSAIPPLVFHWAFNCETCGRRDAVKMGASWRPNRRVCFECFPTGSWRRAEIEDEAGGEANHG